MQHVPTESQGYGFVLDYENVKRIVNDKPLFYYPKLAELLCEYGGKDGTAISERAVLLSYITSLCRSNDGKCCKISYSDLQARFLWLSNKTITRHVASLIGTGLIESHRDGANGKNIYYSALYDDEQLAETNFFSQNGDPKDYVFTMVFPNLAQKVGFMECIALQYIHFYTLYQLQMQTAYIKFDGFIYAKPPESFYGVTAPLRRWKKVFPAHSERAIKGALGSLDKNGLLVKQTALTKNGFPTKDLSYMVKYGRLYDGKEHGIESLLLMNLFASPYDVAEAKEQEQISTEWLPLVSLPEAK